MNVPTVLALLMAASFTHHATAAELKHWTGAKFKDGNATVAYPCSHGGEPLVIYGTPVDNKAPISSKTRIPALWVMPGFEATPLEVAQVSQTDLVSTQRLIIRGMNPGNQYQYVRFTLQKREGTFFVGSVLFATVAVSPEDKMVTMVRGFMDDQVAFSDLFPRPIFNFGEDVGVDVARNGKKLDAFQYTWNQNTPWTTMQHPDEFGIINYKFTPEKNDVGSYDGFGFWVCGSAQPH